MNFKYQKISLLLLIVFFCGTLLSQVWISEFGQPDTTYIRFNLKMVSLSWSIDTLNGGWNAFSTSFAPWEYGSDSARGDSFFTDVGEVEPCSLLIPSYWVENTGGITLDIMVRAEINTESGFDYWTWHPDSFRCSSLNNWCASMSESDIAGMGIVAMMAWPPLVDFAPPEMNSACIPSTACSWEEIDLYKYIPTSAFMYKYPYVDPSGTNLIANDPDSTGDGVFTKNTDQIGLYFYICPPPIPFSTEVQFITFFVTAKISD